MATQIYLKHSKSGRIKAAYWGFSWTTLFFGTFPAFFRGDFGTVKWGFVVTVIVGLLTDGIGSLFAVFFWACVYNRHYTRRLMEGGYQLHSADPHYHEARRRLGISA